MIIEASYQDEDVVFELMNELEAGSLEREAFALQYRSCIENEKFIFICIKMIRLKAVSPYIYSIICIIVMLQEKLVN